MFLLHCFWFISIYTCIAKDAPTLPLPNFNETKAIHRGNLCDRQRKLQKNKINISDALRGLNISVYMGDSGGSSDDYLFQLSPNGTMPENNPGIMPLLLDEVAKRAGFEWRNTFSSAKFSSTGFETHTQLLVWSTNNYDMSAE